MFSVRLSLFQTPILMCDLSAEEEKKHWKILSTSSQTHGANGNATTRCNSLISSNPAELLPRALPL